MTNLERVIVSWDTEKIDFDCHVAKVYRLTCDDFDDDCVQCKKNIKNILIDLLEKFKTGK